jgi:predicted AAA+ superfamily ATPase
MKARYLTLDDRATLDAALEDPDGLLAGMPGPLILDEVQRAPDLLRAVKKIVDADRRPGRFLLTGSAHLSTLSKVAESLAGRAALHELYPLSWAELVRRPPPPILDSLFEAKSASELLAGLRRRAPSSRRGELSDRILVGGFPTPALMRDREVRRTWFESYRQTYLERDLRDLTAIHDLPAFNRLLTLAVLRTGQLLNVSDLARDARVSTTTARRHLELLQQTYQVNLIQPYYANVGKRLVKTPKLYVTDTGLGCHIAAVDNWQTAERQERTGPLLETFVAGELRKLLSLAPGRTHLWYWRVEHGREVDFLLERGGEVVGIEVKRSSGASPDDLAGLKTCRDTLGKRFRVGVLLYTGEETLALDPSLVAMPISVFFGREG